MTEFLKKIPLTDKEIFNIAVETDIGGSDQSVLDFAKAIIEAVLKKEI